MLKKSILFFACLCVFLMLNLKVCDFYLLSLWVCVRESYVVVGVNMTLPGVWQYWGVTSCMYCSLSLRRTAG